MTKHFEKLTIGDRLRYLIEAFRALDDQAKAALLAAAKAMRK